MVWTPNRQNKSQLSPYKLSFIKPSIIPPVYKRREKSRLNITSDIKEVKEKQKPEYIQQQEISNN